MDPRIRIRKNIYIEDHCWDEEEIWSTQANADRRNCFYDFREQEISRKNLKIAKIALFSRNITIKRYNLRTFLHAP
jgi:hypothetical protein